MKPSGHRQTSLSLYIYIYIYIYIYYKLPDESVNKFEMHVEEK